MKLRTDLDDDDDLPMLDERELGYFKWWPASDGVLTMDLDEL